MKLLELFQAFLSSVGLLFSFFGWAYYFYFVASSIKNRGRVASGLNMRLF